MYLILIRFSEVYKFCEIRHQLFNAIEYRCGLTYTIHAAH